MADFDIGDGFRKIFLAGVGAVAMTAEKSQEVVAEFVRKGELTVEQGKSLNQELGRKAKEVLDGTSEEVLRARLAAMSPEDRAAYAAKVARVAASIDEASVKVDVEDAADSDDQPQA